MNVIDTDLSGLSPDMTVADAFGRIAASCIRQFRRNAASMRADRTPENVHQSRVAIRRMRAAMSIFKPALMDGQFEALRAELERLADIFGEVRDLDMVLGGIADPALRARIEAMRSVASARLDETLSSQRTGNALRRLERWSMAGKWRAAADGAGPANQPVGDFAQQALDGRFKRLRKRGRRLAKLPAGKRHQVRIRAKKIRYGSEFFAPLFGHRRQGDRFLKRIEKLQDHLGSLNDAETARRILHPLLDRKALRALRSQKQEKKEIRRAEKTFERLVAYQPFWR